MFNKRCICFKKKRNFDVIKMHGTTIKKQLNYCPPLKEQSVPLEITTNYINIQQQDFGFWNLLSYPGRSQSSQSLFIWYKNHLKQQMRVPDHSSNVMFNPLNAELNPICHLLSLLESATIVVVSRLRVKGAWGGVPLFLHNFKTL